MKYKILSAVIFIIVSMNVHCAAWTASLETKSIRIHPSYVAVYLHNTIAAPDANSEECAGSVIAINRNSVTYKDALSVLLAANIAKQKVKFYVTGCNWGYMETSIIWLNQP